MTTKPAERASSWLWMKRNGFYTPHIFLGFIHIKPEEAFDIKSTGALILSVYPPQIRCYPADCQVFGHACAE